jgi:hypothetical protein
MVRARNPAAHLRHQLAFRQEEIGDRNSLVQQAARVAAQIENQAAHALGLQSVDGFLQLLR